MTARIRRRARTAASPPLAGCARTSSPATWAAAGQDLPRGTCTATARASDKGESTREAGDTSATVVDGDALQDATDMIDAGVKAGRSLVSAGSAGHADAQQGASVAQGAGYPFTAPQIAKLASSGGLAALISRPTQPRTLEEYSPGDALKVPSKAAEILFGRTSTAVLRAGDLPQVSEPTKRIQTRRARDWQRTCASQARTCLRTSARTSFSSRSSSRSSNEARRLLNARPQAAHNLSAVILPEVFGNATIDLRWLFGTSGTRPISRPASCGRSPKIQGGRGLLDRKERDRPGRARTRPGTTVSAFWPARRRPSFGWTAGRRRCSRRCALSFRVSLGGSKQLTRRARAAAMCHRAARSQHIAADWEEFADVRARASSPKSRLRHALYIAVNSARMALAAVALCLDRSASPATALTREDEQHRLDTIE